MANPEIDNYVKPKSEKPKICKDCGGEIVNGICCSFIEPESEQQLTHYYKNIFTLKSGRQIEILTREKLNFSAHQLTYSWKIIGFIKAPLLVEKEVQIVREEIAGTESIKNPCIAQVIPWPSAGELADKLGSRDEGGIDGRGICDDGFGPLEERDKVEKPLSTHDADLSEIDGAGQDRTKLTLAEHKSDCAIHNNPPHGFSSEVTECDCGAIVPCAGQDKTKGIRIGHPQIGPIEN